MKKFILLLIVLLSFGTVSAQDYTMEAYTIDSGGETVSIGDGYLLGGTIGQHDAGTLTGDGYEMSSGFWPEDISIPLAVALSGASTTVRTVFYVSFLLLILGAVTAGMIWRRAEF